MARMETIRRATIYASTDARVASELLSRVLGRALDGVASGPANRQALFDAGYLVESYRQANLIYKYEMLRGAEKNAWQLRETPKGLDGYSWMVSAMAMGPMDPEMEFGASRVTEGAASQAHVRKAITGARAGTPARREPRRVRLSAGASGEAVVHVRGCRAPHSARGTRHPALGTRHPAPGTSATALPICPAPSVSDYDSARESSYSCRLVIPSSTNGSTRSAR